MKILSSSFLPLSFLFVKSFPHFSTKLPNRQAGKRKEERGKREKGKREEGRGKREEVMNSRENREPKRKKEEEQKGREERISKSGVSGEGFWKGFLRRD